MVLIIVHIQTVGLGLLAWVGVKWIRLCLELDLKNSTDLVRDYDENGTRKLYLPCLFQELYIQSGNGRFELHLEVLSFYENKYSLRNPWSK